MGAYFGGWGVISKTQASSPSAMQLVSVTKTGLPFPHQRAASRRKPVKNWHTGIADQRSVHAGQCPMLKRRLPRFFSMQASAVRAELRYQATLSIPAESETGWSPKSTPKIFAPA